MVGPGRKALFQMRGFEPHVLQSGNRQGGSPAACTMEDIAFVRLSEDIFVIGAVGVDPEFNHAARGVDTSGDEPCSLTLADVSDIDDDDLWVIDCGDQIGGFHLVDLRAGFGHHFGCSCFEFRHRSTVAVLECEWRFRYSDARIGGTQAHLRLAAVRD